jgi:chemotaxis methyl-accepting protein methylase
MHVEGHAGPREVLPEILARVRERTGIDFSQYRRSTVERRVWTRMVKTGVLDPASYLDLLREDGAECAHLASTITIKVSRFFRKAEAWAVVRREVVPAIAGGPDAAAWSAGCARGEEAYGLALLAEALPGRPALRVLGTDVDDGALAAATTARYPAAALEEVPADLRELGFARSPATDLPFQVRDPVRERVSFAFHDVTASPPPGRFRLVACRNVLIYLAPAVQRAVQARLVESLLPGGFLWLGEAEWPAGEAMRLGTVSASARLFRSKE